MNITPTFHTGDWFAAYRFFGAHPVSEQGRTGWIFRVWAPNALRIQVAGDFNDWVGQEMNACSSGYWETVVENAQEGQLYKYHIQESGGAWRMRPDPYAFSAELRPDTASRLAKLEFSFQDDAWMRRRGKCYNQPLNIYELHAGSWKRPADDGDADASGWYSYDQLAEKLIPWLKAHHYTHVELLPLAEHPFDGSWGYQTTGYFAPTSRYGTPAQFAAFVNRCHLAGIGVLMDFVPVHFASNADALCQLDGTPLYEYDSDVGISEWGTMNFNYYRGEVCSFLSSAAAIWMEVYHCDGIRMDAVSRAIYWLGDPKRGVNPGAVAFLQRMNHGLNERWPDGIYLAEDSTNYPKVTAPTRYGGLGFDYKWNLGWMHDALEYFATPFDRRREKYHQLTFSMQYFYDELFLLSLSHDEVVHGKKSIIDKLWGTYEEKLAQARLFYLYMYLHPGKKLNFMGNELAHWREWDESRELDWELLRYPVHDAFQRYIAELGQLYAEMPALHSGEYNSECFTWIEAQGGEKGVYAWTRQSGEQTLLCVLNTMPEVLDDYPLYFSTPVCAELLLSSDDEAWGGHTKSADLPRLYSAHTQDAGDILCVTVPPLSGGVYAIELL